MSQGGAIAVGDRCEIGSRWAALAFTAVQCVGPPLCCATDRKHCCAALLLLLLHACHLPVNNAGDLGLPVPNLQQQRNST